MPVALGTSGMTEDTLVLQQKLSARTLRRGLASNKSATGEKEQKRGEKPHGCAVGIPLTVGKTGVKTECPQSQGPCGRYGGGSI